MIPFSQPVITKGDNPVIKEVLAEGYEMFATFQRLSMDVFIFPRSSP